MRLKILVKVLSDKIEMKICNQLAMAIRLLVGEFAHPWRTSIFLSHLVRRRNPGAQSACHFLRKTTCLILDIKVRNDARKSQTEGDSPPHRAKKLWRVRDTGCNERQFAVLSCTTAIWCGTDQKIQLCHALSKWNHKTFQYSK